MANDGKKTPVKRTKSKKQQTKDLTAFAAGLAAAGAAAKKLNKKNLKVFNVLLALVLTAALVCGGLYYYDISPFDFSFGGGDVFKFYAYEDYDYVVKKPTPQAVGGAEDALKIHYIDVGQGDCVFIQFPDGKTMLIDGGKNSKTISNGIVGYLTELYGGEKVTVDYCMLTHCDSDHCGSLDDVIASDKIDVKNVYRPKVASSYENDPLKPSDGYASVSTGVYENFVKAVYLERQSGVLDKIYYNLEGMEISGDGWTLRLYNPSADMYARLNSAAEKNNISPIMLLRYGEITVLFTGDADDKAEKNFIQNVSENLFGDGFDGDVDVLKVAHHGGQESTSEEFLDMVRPEYSIISVGKNNYGHPRPATLNRLEAVGSEVLRTDQCGTIVMCSTGNDITFLKAVEAALLITFYVTASVALAVSGGYLSVS